MKLFTLVTGYANSALAGYGIVSLFFYTDHGLVDYLWIVNVFSAWICAATLRKVEESEKLELCNRQGR